MIKRILITGDFTFPHGSAAASRIRSFAEGFVENNRQVTVLGLAPQTVLKNTIPRALRSLGPIDYRCLAERAGAVGSNQFATRCNRTWGAKIRWFLDAYTVGIRARRELQRMLGHSRWEMLLLYGRSAARLLPLVSVARQHRVPTILDVTELPSMFGGVGGMFSPIYWDWQAGSRLLVAGVDGVSVIARGLEPFVRARGARDVILVPGVEGWGDLPPVPERLANSNFTLLHVSALLPRDNPEMLFECLRRARRMGAPIVLKVTGRYAANPDARELLGRVQSDPELSRVVQFLGELSDQQLRDEMRASDGLVLLRRDSETNVCSFPTRLVEYLQQGRPVVISDVGDISSYLEAGRDAVLLDRLDADRAARQLDALARLPDRGHALGLAGRNRGSIEFDRKRHAQRLLEFAAAASIRRASNEAER